MKVLLSLILLVALGGGYVIYDSQVSYPDVHAARFNLIDGRHIEMPQLAGKAVLVSFWATTCASCIKEIPELIRLYAAYAAKGLEIIAVAMPYDRPDHVLEFVARHKLPYPVSLDIDGRISRVFGNVQITPNNFLLAKDGLIIRQQLGILDIAATEQLLQKILKPKD